MFFPRFPRVFFSACCLWHVLTRPRLLVACCLNIPPSSINVFRLAACCLFFSYFASRIGWFIPHFAGRLSDYCGFSLMTVVKPCSLMTGRRKIGHCKRINLFLDCAIYRIWVLLIRDQCFEEEIYCRIVFLGLLRETLLFLFKLCSKMSGGRPKNFSI